MKRSFIYGMLVTAGFLLSPPVYALLPTLKAVSESFVNDFNQRSATFLLQKDYASAAATAEFAIEKAEPNLGENHPAIALSRHHLFQAYRSLKQYDKAEIILLRSLRIAEAAIGTDHLNLVPNLNALADLYFEQNQYDKAAPTYLRELDILEQSVEESHPNVIAVLEKLVKIYTAQGNSEKTQQIVDRLHKIAPPHPTSEGSK